MNAARRKEIQTAIDNLQKIEEFVANARYILESVSGEEREYYDNMPENMQSGDKGTRAEEAATALEEAHSTLEDLNVEDMIASLETAME